MSDLNDTIERSQAHATFVIERTYPAKGQGGRRPEHDVGGFGACLLV